MSVYTHFQMNMPTVRMTKGSLNIRKNAFESYGLPWIGSGVNQHTWRTSKIGYDTHFDNMSGYDGTYKSQFDAGLIGTAVRRLRTVSPYRK